MQQRSKQKLSTVSDAVLAITATLPSPLVMTKTPLESTTGGMSIPANQAEAGSAKLRFEHQASETPRQIC
jgi:hypothetical protein